MISSETIHSQVHNGEVESIHGQKNNSTMEGLITQFSPLRGAKVDWSYLPLTLLKENLECLEEEKCAESQLLLLGPPSSPAIVVATLQVGQVGTADGIDDGRLPGEGLHGKCIVEHLDYNHTASSFPDTPDS